MKALEITVNGSSFKNVHDFSVEEEATPIDPSSSLGGVGRITFSLLEDADSKLLVGNVTLVEGVKGKTSGLVQSVSGDGEKVSVVSDSILGLFNVERTVPPYVGTLSGAISFYCDFVDIPNVITIDPSIASRAVICPGWKGNVWVGVKQFLAKEQVEMSLVFNQIHVRPLRTLVASVDRSISEGWSIDKSTAARTVQVNYYNNQYGENLEVYPVATDDATIFQVDANETVVFQERVNASLFSVNQPVAQDWVGNQRYTGTTGVYAVVGNDGLPITAAQWNSTGGYVSVAITDDPSIIEVTIHGSTITDYAPYRIAMSSGSSTFYNSLHITGEAIVTTEENVVLKTGITDTSSSNEVGVVVQNPFISTKEEAYSLGLLTAAAYAGLNYTITGTARDINRGDGSRALILATIGDFNEAVDPGTTIASFNTDWSGQTIADFNVYWQEQIDLLFENQSFGNASGARVLKKDANFRIIAATTNAVNVQYTATLDTLMSDFSSRWTGMTIADFNTQFNGKTCKDFSIIPLRRD